MKTALLAVLLFSILGSAEAKLGEKLEAARKQKPNLLEKEVELYGRTFLVRIDSLSKAGVKFVDYFLDEENVEFVAVVDCAQDQISNRVFNKEYAERHWGLVFGKEKIEDKVERKSYTKWVGQNGSSLKFGKDNSKGRKVEYLVVSATKMKVVQDKYFQAELAKIPASKKREESRGVRITFGGNKNKQDDFDPQFYRIAPGGAVYDGNSGRYLGHTVAGEGNE